jgi:hypothetical protein
MGEVKSLFRLGFQIIGYCLKLKFRLRLGRGAIFQQLPSFP